MNMIIALNNSNIEQKIIREYKEENNVKIANSKEEIISLIDIKDDILVIMREDLPGEISNIKCIEKIKSNENNRVIFIVKKLSKTLKEELFSKEVFNIIEGESFSFNELNENIKNPKMVIYKAKQTENKSNIVFVTGVKNSGKSTISNMLAMAVAKIRCKKILLIDLDFIYPALDTYIKVNNNYSMVDLLQDFMNNKLKEIENYESTNKRYKNLKYILNNKEIGIPNEQVLVDLISKLSTYYDYIIIDTSVLMINKIYNVANNLNANIIFVLEPSIKAIRNYIIDVKYISEDMLENTIIILNKSFKNKKVINKIKSMIKGKKVFEIKRHYFIEKYMQNNICIMNFNKVLNFLKISKDKSIKKRIIYKMLNFKEE